MRRGVAEEGHRREEMQGSEMVEGEGEGGRAAR